MEFELVEAVRFSDDEMLCMCVPCLLLQSELRCATFSSDARFIAGAGISGVVCVWDVNSARVRRTFDKPVCMITIVSVLVTVCS